MAELLGVMGHLQKSLKREVLLFDRIAYAGLSFYHEFLRFYGEFIGDHPVRVAKELTWLEQKGVIFEHKLSDSLGTTPPTEWSIASAALSELDSNRKHLTSKFRRLCQYTCSQDMDQAFETGLEILKTNDEAQRFRARLTAIDLRVNHGMDAYPVYSALGASSGEKPYARKTDVLRITLSRFPVLAESTPWEDIMQFRNDTDRRAKFFALRNWMSDTARSQLQPLEVEEKLDWLIHEYERHLELQRIKVQHSVFETILVTSTEIIEELIKFNWSRLAKSFFQLNRNSISLLEAEATGPGREVAYIVDARQWFPSKDQ